MRVTTPFSIIKNKSSGACYLLRHEFKDQNSKKARLIIENESFREKLERNRQQMSRTERHIKDSESEVVISINDKSISIIHAAQWLLIIPFYY